MTAPAPSPDEQAVIERFGIFDEERKAATAVDVDALDAEYGSQARDYAFIYVDRDDLAALIAEVRRGRALRERLEGLAEERESLAQRLRSAAAEPGRNLGQKWTAENRAHDAEREADRLRAALAAVDPS